MQTTAENIKVALLDLYDDYPNTEIQNFLDLIAKFNIKFSANLSCEVFDVRGKAQVPDTSFDIYLSSGGPGSPVDSEGSQWENNYWALIDALDEHNRSTHPQKKHVLFVCHSFQLMCRRLGLATVNQRDAESFGIYPVYQTHQGFAEVMLKGLHQPFYAMDMREWQVINPNVDIIKKLGAQIVAIEMERADASLPRALMAVRFSPYFFGTQFHPEVDPVLLKTQMLDADTKNKMTAEYGEEVYTRILDNLEDQYKLKFTYNTIVPGFLYRAVHGLQHV